VLAADTAVVLAAKFCSSPPASRTACACCSTFPDAPTSPDGDHPGDRARPAIPVEPQRSDLPAISRSEARAYWETGEPRDKAGGYAIQGRAAVFIADLKAAIRE